MNRDNYARIMTMGQTAVATSQTEVVTFELQPGETGFYLSFRDEGTCVDLSRVLVQRFECPSQQKGLVLYPAAPAPVSGSGAVDISCVTNGETAGSGTATCSSEGEWGPETPVCGCSPGYEVDMASNTECDSKDNDNEDAYMYRYIKQRHLIYTCVLYKFLYIQCTCTYTCK